MTVKESQTEMVLDYLMTYGHIDAWTAIHKLNILRLGARIYDLKKRGFKFKTDMIYKKDAEGSPIEHPESTKAKVKNVKNFFIKSLH